MELLYKVNDMRDTFAR